MNGDYIVKSAVYLKVQQYFWWLFVNTGEQHYKHFGKANRFIHWLA